MVKYKFCNLESNSQGSLEKRRIFGRTYKSKRSQEKESSQEKELLR